MASPHPGFLQCGEFRGMLDTPSALLIVNRGLLMIVSYCESMGFIEEAAPALLLDNYTVSGNKSLVASFD